MITRRVLIAGAGATAAVLLAGLAPGAAGVLLYEAVIVAGLLLVLPPLRRDAGRRYRPIRTRPTEPDPPPVPGQLRHLQEIVAVGGATLLDAERGVVPELRRLAADRLYLHHGVVMSESPNRAAELLGEAAWQVLGPRDPHPHRRQLPGLAAAEASLVLDAIEGL